MSETPILNAPVYEHGYVTGRYLTAVADGPDDDHLMDFTPAKGKVIFTPETVIRRHEGPSPALVVQRPVECPINSQGYLTSPDGWRGVSLIVGIYSVRFEVQGAQVPGPKRIQVKASHTQDAPLDLVLSMPEVVPPGSVVVVDETTAQRAEAAAARAEAVVTNLESEVRAVVLASPELKGERGEPGEKGDPGAPGAVPTSSDYLIVGPGRPDQPATTNGVITGDEPVGAEYRSTDGAGAGLFDWMKRPTGWEIAGGGSGIEEVLVTAPSLSVSEPGDFLADVATTLVLPDASTVTLMAGEVAAVRHFAGAWRVFTATPGAVVKDETAPTAGTLAVTVAPTMATLTVTGALDDVALHALPYAYSKDSGATWTDWTDATTYQYTGLAQQTSYGFRHKVRDAAGNERPGTTVTKSTPKVPGFAVVGKDTFTAADGTNVAGRTTEVGGFTTQGTGTILNNRFEQGQVTTSVDAKFPAPTGTVKNPTRVTAAYSVGTYHGSNVRLAMWTNTAGSNTISIVVNQYGRLGFDGATNPPWAVTWAGGSNPTVATSGTMSIEADTTNGSGKIVVNGEQVGTISGPTTQSAYGATAVLTREGWMDDLTIEVAS